MSIGRHGESPDVTNDKPAACERHVQLLTVPCEQEEPKETEKATHTRLSQSRLLLATMKRFLFMVGIKLKKLPKDSYLRLVLGVGLSRGLG